jgi:hypothetical protein
MSAILNSSHMRSMRLIGNSNPRYRWERYWKTQDQLASMPKDMFVQSEPLSPPPPPGRAPFCLFTCSHIYAAAVAASTTNASTTWSNSTYISTGC